VQPAPSKQDLTTSILMVALRRAAESAWEMQESSWDTIYPPYKIVLLALLYRVVSGEARHSPDAPIYQFALSNALVQMDENIPVDIGKQLGKVGYKGNYRQRFRAWVSDVLLVPFSHIEKMAFAEPPDHKVSSLSSMLACAAYLDKQFCMEDHLILKVIDTIAAHRFVFQPGKN
jgi:hypothetical protein